MRGFRFRYARENGDASANARVNALRARGRFRCCVRGCGDASVNFRRENARANGYGYVRRVCVRANVRENVNFRGNARRIRGYSCANARLNSGYNRNLCTFFVLFANFSLNYSDFLLSLVKQVRKSWRFKFKG